MSKKLAITIVLCTCVCIAFGAAKKIKEFDTFDPEPLDADAMAKLNYASGANKTVFQLMMSDFTPGEDLLPRKGTYDYFLITPNAVITQTEGVGTPSYPLDDVWQVQQSGANEAIMPSSAGGFLVPNQHGHLTFHAEISGVDISDSDVLLFAYTGNKTRPDRINNPGLWEIEGELRAEGRQSTQ